MPRRCLQPALAAFFLLATLARAAGPPQAAPRTPPTPPVQAPTATIGSASHIHPPAEGYRFPDKLTYVYAVDWRLWNAGTATLRLEGAGPQVRINATADDTGFAAALYTVRDRFEAFFDPKTFCSASLHKQTQEGRRAKDTFIRFDYANRKRLLDEKDLRQGQSKHTEAEIPACVTDVLSGIYYVGSLPLRPGATHIFPLNDGGQTVDVKAHVEAREEIKTTAGTFQAMRVEIQAASGMLKDRGQIYIWYSDDAARLPVQARARMFWGTLTLHLVRVERK